MNRRSLGLVVAAALLAGALMPGCGSAKPPAPPDPTPSAPAPESLPPGSISLSVPAAIKERRQPAEIRYSYRDIPPGSWLVLSLETTDESQRFNWSGPLMMEPVPIFGTGQGVFSWDTLRVGCAPTDAPEWCAAGIGRHRITAKIYDQAYLGLGMVRPMTQPVVRATAESPIFVLSGDRDYGSALLALERTARKAYWRKARDQDPAMPFLAQHVFKQGGQMTSPAGLRCMRFEAEPPLTGGVTACGKFGPETDGRPRDMHGTWTLDNSLQWRPGDARVADAWPAVLSALRAEFPSMTEVRPAPPNVWSAPLNSRGAYRADERRWVLEVRLFRRAPGNTGETDRRIVQLLTDRDGRVCIVEIVEGYRATPRLDDPAIRCPDRS